MYLFEVKKPEESKGEWDLYKLIATVPGDEAFRPLDKGGCPLVKAGGIERPSLRMRSQPVVKRVPLCRARFMVQPFSSGASKSPRI